jgi:hypothetical protein
MARKSKEQADKDWAEARGRSRALRKLNYMDEFGTDPNPVKPWMIGVLHHAIEHHYGPEGLPSMRSYVSAGSTGDSKMTLDQAVDMELAGLLTFVIHQRPQSLFAITTEGRALVGAPIQEEEEPSED